MIYLLLFFLNIGRPSKADMFGGDLPLLAEIVFNTLNTLHELEKQSSLMEEEMKGIKDKIYRIETISHVIQGSSWDEWRDPKRALKKLETIYYTVPKEYRTEKSDQVMLEVSQAMNLVARVNSEMPKTFDSGKELEEKAMNVSPSVAQKLTASGVGSLIAIETQSQVLQSQMTSLLSQMLVSINEKESRSLVQKGHYLNEISENLQKADSRFSHQMIPFWVRK